MFTSSRLSLLINKYLEEKSKKTEHINNKKKLLKAQLQGGRYKLYSLHSEEGQRHDTHVAVDLLLSLQWRTIRDAVTSSVGKPVKQHSCGQIIAHINPDSACRCPS